MSTQKRIQLTSKLIDAIYFVTHEFVEEVRIIGKTYWFRYEGGGCSFVSSKVWAEVEADIKKQDEVDNLDAKYQELISRLEDEKPRFSGSDKQCNWASSIYDVAAASLARGVIYGGSPESVLSVLGEQSASWWIENRQKFGWVSAPEYRNRRRTYGY